MSSVRPITWYTQEPDFSIHSKGSVALEQALEALHSFQWDPQAYGEFDKSEYAPPAIGFQDDTEAFIEVSKWGEEPFLVRHMQVEINTILVFNRKTRIERFAVVQDLAEVGRAIKMFFDGNFDGLIAFMRTYKGEP